jgi:hypothetical protein
MGMASFSDATASTTASPGDEWSQIGLGPPGRSHVKPSCALFQGFQPLRWFPAAGPGRLAFLI